MAKKILVADDEPHIVRLLKDVLSRRGYEVITAEAGDRAVALAKSEVPALIFLDVMMPNLSGFEACQQIRSEPALAGVPIFLLTARGQERDVEQGKQVGADRYLTKPFSPRQLADLVDAALGGAT
ncbi:MAG: response regulator [Fimbriimonadaceae bacterium]|nr:response regulator [Fimbriimonadaceae bacterium]